MNQRLETQRLRHLARNSSIRTFLFILALLGSARAEEPSKKRYDGYRIENLERLGTAAGAVNPPSPVTPLELERQNTATSTPVTANAPSAPVRRPAAFVAPPPVRQKGAKEDPIEKVADDFESMMLSHMYQQLNRQRVVAAGDDNPFAPSNAEVMFQSMLDDQMMQQVSKSRPLGVANLVARQLRGETGVGQRAPVRRPLRQESAAKGAPGTKIVDGGARAPLVK